MFAPLIAEIELQTALAWGSVVCAAVAALFVAAAYPRIRETTLVGPWCWALAWLSAMAAVEAAVALDLITDSAPAWRFAAVVGAFTPWMSVLGAKRPQDQAWHFIVASLWGIQAMPALEVLLLKPGQPLAIADFRAFFLLLLIGIALLVYVMTRFALPALVAAAGHLMLVWQYLPWAADYSGYQMLGMALLATATACAWVLARGTRGASGFDRLWLDFRDAFGALWAARVLERVNAAAMQYGWPVRLGWSGFCSADNPLQVAAIPPSQTHEVKQVFVNLLRRFVAIAWIDRRLEPARPDAEHDPV